MTRRAGPAVALTTLVLLAGVVPALAIGGPIGTDRPDSGGSDDLAQYKVSLNNVTIETWLLRNSTVRNATVRSVVVRDATTVNGSRTDVTITNVTVGRFDVERGRLKNVTARQLVVRNRSVLDVPGGDLVDPNVENRTIERHWTRNATAAGVVIDRLVVDAAYLCENAALGPQAPADASFSPTASGETPAVAVRNGTVGEALIIRGEATNWSVGSIDSPATTNASLPDACRRG